MLRMFLAERVREDTRSAQRLYCVDYCELECTARQVIVSVNRHICVAGCGSSATKAGSPITDDSRAAIAASPKELLGKHDGVVSSRLSTTDRSRVARGCAYQTADQGRVRQSHLNPAVAGETRLWHSPHHIATDIRLDPGRAEDQVAAHAPLVVCSSLCRDAGSQRDRERVGRAGLSLQAGAGLGLTTRLLP